MPEHGGLGLLSTALGSEVAEMPQGHKIPQLGQLPMGVVHLVSPRGRSSWSLLSFLGFVRLFPEQIPHPLGQTARRTSGQKTGQQVPSGPCRPQPGQPTSGGQWDGFGPQRVGGFRGNLYGPHRGGPDATWLTLVLPCSSHRRHCEGGGVGRGGQG